MSKIRRLATATLILVTVGCTAQTGTTASAPVFSKKTFTAPIGQSLTVNTGDSIFVEGSYIPGEIIEIPEAIEMMIPGSMLIPFPIRIEAGQLKLSAIDRSWKYYCAEEGKAAASFPGLGSVIAKGDCVGIRISLDGARKRWVVDNSIHNGGMRTIWDRSFNAADHSTYVPFDSSQPFQIQQIRKITFNGYYGGQLHFTWEEVAQNTRDSRDFTFDFDSQPTIIGIRGNRFEALHADNTQLLYQWIQFQ